MVLEQDLREPSVDSITLIPFSWNFCTSNDKANSFLEGCGGSRGSVLWDWEDALVLLVDIFLIGSTSSGATALFLCTFALDEVCEEEVAGSGKEDLSGRMFKEASISLFFLIFSCLCFSNSESSSVDMLIGVALWPV